MEDSLCPPNEILEEDSVIALFPAESVKEFAPPMAARGRCLAGTDLVRRHRPLVQSWLAAPTGSQSQHRKEARGGWHFAVVHKRGKHTRWWVKRAASRLGGSHSSAGTLNLIDNGPDRNAGRRLRVISSHRRPRWSTVSDAFFVAAALLPPHGPQKETVPSQDIMWDAARMMLSDESRALRIKDWEDHPVSVLVEGGEVSSTTPPIMAAPVSRSSSRCLAVPVSALMSLPALCSPQARSPVLKICRLIRELP